MKHDAGCRLRHCSQYVWPHGARQYDTEFVRQIVHSGSFSFDCTTRNICTNSRTITNRL